MSQTNFISNIDVVYGTQPSQIPSNAVRDINGANADINGGFKGSYVWLVPVLTTTASTGAVAFQIIIQKDADSALSDLAKGTGGDYRYIIPEINAGNNKKVYDVGQLRSPTAVAAPPPGYDGMTTDINAGRGGDYLYVLWKSVTTN